MTFSPDLLQWLDGWFGYMIVGIVLHLYVGVVARTVGKNLDDGKIIGPIFLLPLGLSALAFALYFDICAGVAAYQWSREVFGG